MQVPRAVAGDPAAFDVLYRRHHRSVHAIARRYGTDSDTVADICQEVWARVFQALPAFRGECRFSTWLHRVAVRTSLSACRTHGRKAARETDLHDSQPDASAAAEVTILLKIQLDRALIRLPRGKRRVLEMFDIEGHSHEEIAGCLGISTGTCKSQLSKARSRMRELLADLQPHAPQGVVVPSRSHASAGGWDSFCDPGRAADSNRSQWILPGTPRPP